MNTELGYYAGHVVVTMPLTVVLETWETAVLNVQFEIQIATQVQEVIRRLLHAEYEKSQSDTGLHLDWRWDYKGRPFAANYLGYVLHYLEGQVMRVREDTPT